MTLEQAVDYALEHRPPPGPTHLQPTDDLSEAPVPPQPLSSHAQPVALTRREQEVLQLVARGVRTVEVAATLGVSPLTINVHLRAIYRKLGVQSRTAATHVAHQQQLI